MLLGTELQLRPEKLPTANKTCLAEIGYQPEYYVMYVFCDRLYYASNEKSCLYGC